MCSRGCRRSSTRGSLRGFHGGEELHLRLLTNSLFQAIIFIPFQQQKELTGMSKILISAALAAIVSIVGFNSPAAAQNPYCGGSVGEGCLSPQAQERVYRHFGLPQPRPTIGRPRTGGPYVVGGTAKKRYDNRQGGGTSWSQHTQTRGRVVRREEWHRKTTTFYTIIRRWHERCVDGVCTKTYLETNE